MRTALFKRAEARRRLYARGMNAAQLAREVGVSQAAISAYFSGVRQPSARVFVRICTALDVEPEDLMGDPAPAPVAAAPGSQA